MSIFIENMSIFLGKDLEYIYGVAKFAKLYNILIIPSLLKILHYIVLLTKTHINLKKYTYSNFATLQLQSSIMSIFFGAIYLHLTKF